MQRYFIVCGRYPCKERGEIKTDSDNVRYPPSSGIKAMNSFLWGSCFVILSCSITVQYGKLTQTVVKSDYHAGKGLWRGAEQAWSLCFGLYNYVLLVKLQTSRISDPPVSQRENRKTGRSQHKYSCQEICCSSGRRNMKRSAYFIRGSGISLFFCITVIWQADRDSSAASKRKDTRP